MFNGGHTLIHLFQVIDYLYPNIEWTLEGDTIEGLYFNDKTIQKPTQTQIDEAFKELKKIELAHQAKQESAKAKLVALGLTLEDLESLGLGHSHA